MKELITVAASFLIVVALAFYMYVANEKHSVAVIKTEELNQVVEKKYEELKLEIEAVKAHASEIDSIYHKKTNE